MGGRRARPRSLRIGTVRATALVLALGAAASAAPGAVRAAHADDSAVAIDRQVYVTTAPADPYNNDQLSLHVAAAGGSEVARSYLHLSFDGLPDGSTVSNAVMTLTVDTSSTNNASNASAKTTTPIISACVLTQPIPASVTNANAPAYDCSKGSAVGKPPPDPAATVKRWTFSLSNLVSYWAGSANNGLVLVGVIAPGDSWSVGFDKTQAGATATYAVRPSGNSASRSPDPAPSSAPAPAPAPSPESGTLGGITFAPAPASPSVPIPLTDNGAATPSASANPAPTAAADSGIRTVPGTRSSRWIWVLLAALVVAALLAAQPVVAILTAGVGNVRSALTAQLQGHARAMMTSFVVIVWTITYGAYSIVVPPQAHVIAGGGFASSNAAPTATNNDTTNAGDPTAATTNGVAGATGNRATGPARSGATSQAIRQSAGNSVAPIDPNTLPPAARLYSTTDDRIGMTDTTIKLCGHAALALGPAFSIGKDDLNVFWQNLNDHGGINGRKFEVSWNDDVYQPSNAVTAAQQCKDAGNFMLLGGIGFDQIPAVRVWAEQNKMLYLHHIAVKRGSEGLRYSFTGLPSVEEMGRTFGELVVQKYAGHKVGIIWRNSSNWQPGRDEFRKVVTDCNCGIKIVGDYAVSNNQGTYTRELADLSTQGADVVFSWENATAATNMITQAKRQAYSPHWLVFPFNLTTKTIMADALNPPLEGLAAWPAYAFNQHDGPYASYASDLIEFEREYAQYDPGARLDSYGGDLLFLAWVGFKQMADLFQQCGRDCSRNKMAATLLTYHHMVTPNCDADFTAGDHHHAAARMDVLTVTADSSGQPAWIPTRRCVSSLR